MHCKCLRENFRRGGSYIDSPEWIRKKKATMNLNNTNDKCFQYATTAALIYEEIESHPERVSKTKPYVKKYKWKGNYLSKIDHWKTF